MNKQQAMARLAACGTAQNRKVYARHGVRGEAYGVSYANLGKLAREIGVDHGLAEELWQTGNHDARVLATMIADPQAVTASLADKWLADVDNSVLTDALAKLTARSAAAEECMRRWATSADEWRGAAGWTVLGAIVERQPEAELEGCLRAIEATIHRAKNRVRYAMNNALIGIGLRGKALQAKAIAVARRIGKVEVDHGETGCKTPDAIAYIQKAAAYRTSKGAAKKAPAKKAAPAKNASAKGENASAKAAARSRG